MEREKLKEKNENKKSLGGRKRMEGRREKDERETKNCLEKNQEPRENVRREKNK